MNKWFLFLLMTAALLSLSTEVVAAPHGDKKTPAPKKTQDTKAAAYQCPDCHDKFSLARAKKEKMMCSCCQTKLVLVKASIQKGRK